MKSYELAALAMLSALAIVLQYFNNVLGVQTPFGMTVDLVGVPAILALFIFGFEASIYVAAVTALAITFIAPTTWLGASMKFAATIAFPLVAAFMAYARGRNLVAIGIGGMLVAGLMTAVLLMASGTTRVMATTAGMIGELTLGLLPVIVLAFIAVAMARLWKRYAGEPNFKIFSAPAIFLVALVISLLVRGIAMTVANYYYAGPVFYGMSTAQVQTLFPWWLIFGWNAVQGAVECAAAWILAYEYRLVKYGQR